MLLSRSTSRFAMAFCLLLLLQHTAQAALLNFRDVEIRQLIESVAELTGKNFLVDPRVKGKFTLIATTQVPDDQVYDVMLSVFRMHGLRAVEGPGGLTRIVPANIAGRYSTLDESEGLVTKIIPIKHLNAGGVLPMVRPLMTSQAQVTIHKETNSLIVVETLSNIERVEEILRDFDKESVGSYEIVDLDYMTAKDMVNVINRARNKQIKHLADVVADTKFDRLILTGEPRFRLPLRALIAELDAPPRVRKGKAGLVRIIHLNYANAEEMKTVLKGLLTKQFLELADFGADTADTTPAPKKKVVKAPKKPADKKDAKEPAPAAAPSPITNKSYTIQSDVATNSLIVSGATNIVQAIVDVVRELDTPRPQVLIEAIIAEITLNRAADLQTRLVGQKTPRGAEEPVTFSGGAVTGITSLEGLFAAFNFIGGPSAQYFAGGRFNGGDLTIGLLINALRTDATANILSTPSILTLNNETAKLVVGSGRPFVERSELIAGTTEYRDFFKREDLTLEFEVTPQITKGDAVRLKVKQTDKRADEAALADSGGGEVRNFLLPTLNREIETDVIVNDRDVIILGGMTRDERADSKSEIPLLADIPVVGHLFRGRAGSERKLNLMVFVRPTIFRTPEAAADTSGDRYVALRWEQLQQLQRVDSLIDQSDHGPSLMPPLRELQNDGKTKRKVKKRKKRKKRMRSSRDGISRADG